jgi:hypothetical protein
MTNLPNTEYGYKQKLIIGGINSWNVLNEPSLNVVFFIEILDQANQKVDDKSITQNREIVYNLNNTKRVDAQFNPVQTGGTGEYDYFWNSLQTILMPTLIIQLATKLNERGIFN